MMIWLPHKKYIYYYIKLIITNQVYIRKIKLFVKFLNKNINHLNITLSDDDIELYFEEIFKSEYYFEDDEEELTVDESLQKIIDNKKDDL